MTDTERQYLISAAKCLKLDIVVPHNEMLAEARALKSQFTEYRTGGYQHSGWRSLTIHGLAADKGFNWDHYGLENANQASSLMHWTEIADQCPVTVNWLKTVFPSNRYGRVRFLMLSAGGYIGLHSDTDSSILEMVNVALNHPAGCVWSWGDGTTIDFQPGDAYAVNISYPHKVDNHSSEDRYHLIVHHHDSTPEWVEMMTAALKEHNEQGNFVYSKELY